MPNEYHVIPLIKGSNTEFVIKELTSVFGTPGQNWFVYNNQIYIRNNSKELTWFVMRYG